MRTLNNGLSGVAVAQGVESVNRKVGGLIPDSPQAMCRSILEQDSEPQVAPDRQAGALHGSLPPSVCVSV